MKNTVDPFVQVAIEFCSLIENHQQYTVGQLLTQVRKVMPLLYYHALLLPDTDVVEGYEHNRDITHEQWHALYLQLLNHTGEYDSFWEIFDPIEKVCKEPAVASLADALADIWRDLKNGLLHWENSSDVIKAHIIWQWKFNFKIHWSIHVVDALRALNWLIEVYDAADELD